MIDSKRIGKQLKDLRISRGWKQADVADKVCMSRPAMSNIESGKRSLTLNTLKRFCEIFGVDVSYFGINTEYDDVLDLASRAELLFANENLPVEKKDELYLAIMEMYLNSKQTNK